MTDCFLAHLGNCQLRADGQLDRAHLIPASRLRINHVPKEAIWDERAWVPMCRRHHHLLDAKFIRLSREELPVGVESFADEFGLWWSLDMDYGELVA